MASLLMQLQGSLQYAVLMRSRQARAFFPEWLCADTHWSLSLSAGLSVAMHQLA